MAETATGLDFARLGRNALRWLVFDWRWKGLALLLATLLYFVIRGSIRHTQTLVVPIDIDPQAQVAAATIEPLSAEVTIQGTLNELQRFSGRDLRLVLRPGFSNDPAVNASWIRRWLRSLFGSRSMVRSHTEEFRLSARRLRGARENIRVVKIEPKMAKVTYDVRGEVDLPVAEPVVVGKPYRGRVVIDYSPRTVRVTGSRDQLDAMVANGVQLQTEPVDVEGRVQGYKKTLPILQPSMTRLVKFEPAEVSAEVKIIADRFTREFQDVPVLLAAAPGGGGAWRASPEAVGVRLSGRAEMIAALQTNQVAVMVDLRTISGSASNTLPVQVVLPYDSAVETVEISPPEVTVVPGASAVPSVVNPHP